MPLPHPLPALPVEDLALTIRGHRLAARWVRPAPAADRPPLVLLHEGLGSIGQWSRRGVDVPGRLAAETGRPVFLYDRLGFGGSDPLPGPRGPDYLYREAWEELPAVLDAVGIARAHLVGHSDGGTIALLFAARFGGRVLSVASAAAHVIVEPETLAGIRAAHEAFHAPDGRLRAALARFHGDKVDATFSGWADIWLTPGFDRFDMLAELPRVACPVLALQGDRDEYGTPRQLDLIAAHATGPVETWLVLACGHAPHLEAADSVLPRIARFVARVEAGAL